MSMTIEGKIDFGVDGWYGIIADDFTFENVWRVARAISTYLETVCDRNRPILIGYDTRFLADRFAHSAAEILTDFNLIVKIVDRDCPTPALCEGVRSMDSAGALMFTASNRHAKYCGIKYIPDDGYSATNDIIDRIVANLDKTDNSPPSGKNSSKIGYFDPKPDYLKFIYNSLNIDALKNAALKVRFDALHSTSRGYLDSILDYCNIDLASVNIHRDVLFSSGTVEATVENLQQLTESVKKDKADLGLAVSGDSTQFAIVDDRGQIIPSQAILSVLSQHISQNRGQIITKDGTAYDLGQIASDGILSSMLVVEAVAMTGKPLSQLVEEGN
jgi:phosphomannomutase